MAKGSGYSVVSNSLRAAVANNRAQQSNGKRASGGVKSGGLKFAPSQKSVTQFRAKLIDQFGKALGASIYKQTDVYSATAEAGRLMVKGGKVQLAANAQTIGDVQTIFKQGASAQSAAAAYAKALQLKEQTAASDSQVAAFAADMMMAEQQHKWALEEADHNAALAAKAAEQSGGSKAQVQTLIDDGAAVATDIQSFMFKVKSGEVTGADGQPLTYADGAPAIIAAWKQSSVYASDPNYGTVGAYMIQGMAGGEHLNAAPAYESALKLAYSGMPGSDKWLSHAAAASSASMQAKLHAAFRSSGPEGYHYDEKAHAWVDKNGTQYAAEAPSISSVHSGSTKVADAAKAGFRQDSSNSDYYIGPDGNRYHAVGGYIVPL